METLVVGRVSEKYVLLVSRKKAHGILLKREWLPGKNEVGEPVKLDFKPAGDLFQRWLSQEAGREGRPWLKKKRPLHDAIDSLDRERFIDMFTKSSPELYRQYAKDSLLAFVEAITSDHVLLRVGHDFFKVVAPREWLPKKLLIAAEFNILLQPIVHRLESTATHHSGAQGKGKLKRKNGGVKRVFN